MILLFLSYVECDFFAYFVHDSVESLPVIVICQNKVSCNSNRKPEPNYMKFLSALSNIFFK